MAISVVKWTNQPTICNYTNYRNYATAIKIVFLVPMSLIKSLNAQVSISYWLDLIFWFFSPLFWFFNSCFRLFCFVLFFSIDDCDKDGTQCTNGVCLNGVCHCNDGWGGCNCNVQGGSLFWVFLSFLFLFFFYFYLCFFHLRSSLVILNHI